MTPDAAFDAAVRNNAHWCDAVCRSHGIEGSFGDDAWVSPRRTPPYYPDAVTLSRRADASILRGVDMSGPGCSVKDSYACLDLSDRSFRVLLEARWIVRGPGRPPNDASGLAWTTMGDAAALAAWEDAWRGSDGPADVFRAGLLGRPDVVVVAGHRAGKVAAGAVLSLGAGVVGLSNVFAADGADDPWPGCLAAAERTFPGRPVVGYESGDDLARAVGHGFADIGPLRIWLADRPTPCPTTAGFDWEMLDLLRGV